MRWHVDYKTERNALLQIHSMNRATFTFIATMIAMACIMVWVVHRVDNRQNGTPNPVGWQASDTPRDGGEIIDPWLEFPNPWLEAATPVIDGIGTPHLDDQSIRAIADGVVVFSGMRGDQYAAILAHQTSDGTYFESIYRPLSTVACRTGELIGRGMLVGHPTSSPLHHVTPTLPEGLARGLGEKSKLAIELERSQGEIWQQLEINNAIRMIELDQ